MKKIGKTDSGAVIVEMTPVDVMKIASAARSLIEELEALVGGEIRIAAPIPANNAPQKRTPKQAEAKPAKAKPSLASKVCLACKKTFTPHRKDQTCCSRACRAKMPRSTYAKYDAAAAKAKRLAALKELDQRKRGTFTPHDDGIPAELKQAHREASAE